MRSSQPGSDFRRSLGSPAHGFKYGQGVQSGDTLVTENPLRLLFHVWGEVEVERFRLRHHIQAGLNEFPILRNAADTRKLLERFHFARVLTAGPAECGVIHRPDVQKPCGTAVEQRSSRLI